MVLHSLKQRWLTPARHSLRDLVYRHPAPATDVATREYVASAAKGCQFHVLDLEPADRNPDARELFVAEICQGRVFGEGLVVTHDNRVLRDVYQDFGDDTLQRKLIAGPNLPKPRQVDGRLAVLMAPGANCYFHWLFDILPRLGLLRDQEVDRYYVSTQKCFHREFLRLCGIAPEKRLRATRHSHYVAQQLFVPSLPGHTGRVTSRSCNFLRDLLPHVNDGLRDSDQGIFVSRKDAKRRRIVNEEEVWKMLRRRGFKRVTLSGLSVRDQMRLFASAPAVVAPHGAGLSNLVFCRPGIRVVECFSPTYVNGCFRNVAHHVKLDYKQVVGDAAGRSQAETLKQDIRVDVARLSEALG